MSLDSATRSAPVERAAALATTIAAGIQPSMDRGYLVDASVEALRASGLFELLVPQSLGGAEAGAHAGLDVIAEISHQDGAAGWSLMAGMVLSGIAGSLLEQSAVEEMFASGGNAICAGQVAPRGTAIPEGGGYRLSGTFSFGSGSRHAGWMFGGFREMRDGKPAKLENGLPNVLGACVPQSRATLSDNWDVLGLMGTGSYDFSIQDELVESAFTFPLFTARPQRGGSFYRLGVHGLTAIGHSGFAMGVGRRALDELARLAPTKKRIGKDLLIELPTFHRDFAEIEARYRAACAYVRHIFTELERAAASDDVTLALRAECRLATTLIVDTAAEASLLAYRQAGSDGLRNGSAIQRCFRDAHAATQHVFTDEKSMIDAAQVLLGVAPPSLIL